MNATITVNRTELGSAVTFAAQASPKHTALPVLTGMRVAISAGTFEVSAFDFDMAARAKVTGDASGPADLLVTGPELVAAVKSLPKGRRVTAEITLTDTQMVIVCEGTETTLAGRDDAAEYPQMPALPAESGVMDAETFTRSVTRVAACAGRDDTLPVLTCVNLTGDDGALEMAATDRYRLAVDRPAWTGAAGIRILVPAHDLERFAKKCDRSGKISLHLDTDRAGFTDGTRTIIVRTVEGEYPRYRALMRDQDDTTVTVDAATLTAAAKRAGDLAGRNDPVRFSVNGQLVLSAMRDGEVAGTQTVHATHDGPDLETAFNPGYLASVVAGVDGEARIGFVGNGKYGASGACPRSGWVRGDDHANPAAGLTRPEVSRARASFGMYGPAAIRPDHSNTTIQGES